MKIFVKSSLDWLISVHDGSPLTPLPHGWSRSTDQNASLPIPLPAAKFSTVCASASVKISAASSLRPIIGVIPMLA